MRRQTKFSIFTLALLTALAMAKPGQADITFAVVGGMSGPFSKIGKEFTEGARGAAEAINEAGGVLGQPVKFIVRDGKCDAKEAVKIAQEVVEKKIPFVMGHLCSDASIAASEIYEKAGIIQISPSSTNPKYTDRGFKNVFRTTGRDDMQGFVIAEHILRSFKTKKIGVAFEDDAYSRGVAEVTRKFLNQGGIQELFFEQLPKGTTDFKRLFALISKHKVSVLLFPGFPGSIVSYAEQAKKANIKARLVGGDSFSGIKFTKENKRLFDGAQFSFPPDPAHDRRNKKITKRYKKSGYKPEAFTFYTYGAVQLWAQAANKAGTLNAEAVAKTLRSRKFKTVLGEVNFDAKGDISNPGFVMYFFNKGKRYYLE